MELALYFSLFIILTHTFIIFSFYFILIPKIKNLKKLQKPAVHRGVHRDDIMPNEQELCCIVHQHLLDVFQRPLSGYTSTSYEIENLHTQPALVDSEGGDSVTELSSVSRIRYFFVQHFLTDLLSERSGRGGGGGGGSGSGMSSSSTTEYEECGNSDVVFYSRLFNTRLWYQWLSLR